MHKRIAAILATGGAAALTLGLTAGPAFAATWTVSPGGSITAAPGTTTLKDTNTGNMLSCTSSSTSATLKSGTGLAGSGIGSVKGISFTNCSGPLGLTFTVAPGNLPWKLNAATFASGVTPRHDHWHPRHPERFRVQCNRGRRHQ